jgi:putative transposase
MTYLWTPEGWLYLAVIIDLFSRRVVGWSMSERIDRQLAWTPSAWRSRNAVRRAA